MSRKIHLPPNAVVGPTVGESLALISEEKPKKPKHGSPYRSKWEAEWALFLEEQKRVNNALYDIRFERVSFCLVPRSETQKGVWYVPDFTLWDGGVLLQVHEVKGFWRPGAKHKVKALAAMLKPIPVYVVRKEGGEWTKERF